MAEKNNIEYDIADVVIGRPYGFSVGRKRFCLYPITLAKMLLLKRHMDSIEVNQTILRANPFMEALRIVRTHKETCCRIIAIHTAPNTYKDLFDQRSITIRKNYFMENLEEEEMATLAIMILNEDKTEAFIKHLGIDKENERMMQVMEIKRKNDSNNVSFGGVSLFGTFIGQLKEMGYTDNEILYERGYTFLRLMLADKVTSVYLTDEEKEQIPALQFNSVMDASDPKNAQNILAILSNGGLKAETGGNEANTQK